MILPLLSKVILIFPDVQQLLLFAQTMGAADMEINEKQKFMACSCNAEDISRAICVYQGKLFQ